MDQRMTERERLTERIRSAMCWGWTEPSEIAERLIEDGDVIVPPCKVGDTVYKVMDFAYSAQMLEIKILRIEIQGEMRFYAKTVKHYRYNYIWFDSTDIGKTVFLTHEEAEAALAERRKA